MTAKKTDLAGLPEWPRLLSREQASAYLGLSPSAFDTHFPGIKRIHFGRSVRYDRLELDARIDTLKTDSDAIPNKYDLLELL